MEARGNQYTKAHASPGQGKCQLAYHGNSCMIAPLEVLQLQQLVRDLGVYEVEEDKVLAGAVRAGNLCSQFRRRSG